ncbi:DUF2785 domain-containing protein [Henriciella litoralis]|uniref:DUF2785 domain-containing protein n=1 Tax=Henriciella litoralis TaxID=568102 RepID=UPI0009FCC88B|nr:DUF2785 domain-containing protein [Henriciella litoralis]
MDLHQSTARKLTPGLLARGWRGCASVALVSILAATVAALPIEESGGPVNEASGDSSDEREPDERQTSETSNITPADAGDTAPASAPKPLTPEQMKLQSVLRGDLQPGDALVAIPEAWASRARMYAEPKTVAALDQMRRAAAADGITLTVLSAFRSFTHQRGIWERKWVERENNPAFAEPKARALDILRYSSMPGTSRHHWGTDIDLNSLNNGWFEYGEGKAVYEWLTENAADFGFCQVYSSREDGRRMRGYEPERWHWSYIPTAAPYLDAYEANPQLRPSGFMGAEVAEEIGWLTNYVSGINPDCRMPAMRAEPAPKPWLTQPAIAGALTSEGNVEDRQAMMSTSGQCLPDGWTKASLLTWKENDFALSDKAKAGDYALVLAGCLGDPDPAIRDGIAYEGLTRLLRDGRVNNEGLRELKTRLLKRLAPGAEDPQGFSRPFAALALSEVARTDRIAPWMSAEERLELVEAGAAYLEQVDDYRGFVDGEGWRHGVAHASDLMMQLALNPSLPDGANERMLVAIASKIAPRGGPAYVFDEPHRLARPIIYLTQNGYLDAGQLQSLFNALQDPAPLDSWGEAFKSEAALMRRHNLRAFASDLLISVSQSDNPVFDPIRSGAQGLLAVTG